jgi:hypothetical protein
MKKNKCKNKVSFIRMVLDLKYLNLWLEKVILNFKQDNNKMQENIFHIYWIKYKNQKNNKSEMIQDKYFLLKWKTEYNVKLAKR